MVKRTILIMLIIVSIDLKANSVNNNGVVWGTVTKNNAMTCDDDIFIKQKSVIKYNRKTGLVETASKYNFFNFVWFSFNTKKKVKVREKQKNKQIQIENPR